MAVQIINPVDNGFPMSSLTVEADTETEEEFVWVSLLCCSYGTPDHTDINIDWDEDINV